MKDTKNNWRIAGPFGACVMLVAALAPPGAGQVTVRVNLDAVGAQGDDTSFAGFDASISADGRYVAFQSDASNLVPGDTNGSSDIFVRDRQTGTVERVSVDSAGVQADFGCTLFSMSADGRYVAFQSYASNLVVGDSNGTWDVFVRERQSGTTRRVSVDSAGVQGNDSSYAPSISADGRYVAFYSFASNLVGGDTNAERDVFVRDLQTGTTERASVGLGGAQGNGFSLYPAISADGRYVAFSSNAPNLVAGDTNDAEDIFVRDRQTSTTERVSVDSAGAQGNGSSGDPSISGDGRYVAFWSSASNLVASDANGFRDVFVRDRQTGTTELASLTTAGLQGNNESIFPSICADGRYVAFWSYAYNLVQGDTNFANDVFVHDRQAGTTERVSLDSAGAQGNSHSLALSISADARYVVFESDASNLVPADTNSVTDIFVRDRFGGPSFTSVCDAGVGGVIFCPCANPPSGAGRGCNNSSNTGGAVLSASGGTFLSSDSLVFTTSGERPTATSVLLQGTTLVAGGVVYGQGIRCVGGTLKRLFTKSAAGGSITAPDFGAGDPQVSVRSAALGDLILAGQSRWYLVYYRDPTVLGGCPASSTFNATQTGRATWSP